MLDLKTLLGPELFLSDAQSFGDKAVGDRNVFVTQKPDEWHSPSVVLFISSGLQLDCPDLTDFRDWETVKICNICGSTDFGDMRNRIGVRCSGCKSLERHRMIALVLDSLNISKRGKVLVLAPDLSLLHLLRSRGLTRVTTADLQPELFRKRDPNVRKLDLTEVDHNIWKPETYDLIIHSHVVEHIPATLASPMYEIFRLQKKSGKQIAVIPFMAGTYQEILGSIPTEERVERFGQDDHVRRIGTEDVAMTLGKIVRLKPVDFSVEFDLSTLRIANIPESLWSGLNFSTVNVFSKSDWLLSF